MCSAWHWSNRKLPGLIQHTQYCVVTVWNRSSSSFSVGVCPWPTCLLWCIHHHSQLQISGWTKNNFSWAVAAGSEPSCQSKIAWLSSVSDRRSSLSHTHCNCCFPKPISIIWNTAAILLILKHHRILVVFFFYTNVLRWGLWRKCVFWSLTCKLS